MTTVVPSLAVELWDRYGLIDETYWSSRNDVWQMLLICCGIDSGLLRWTLMYLTNVFKGTPFPPTFVQSQSIKSRWDAEPAGTMPWLLQFCPVWLSSVSIKQTIKNSKQHFAQTKLTLHWQSPLIHKYCKNLLLCPTLRSSDISILCLPFVHMQSITWSDLILKLPHLSGTVSLAKFGHQTHSDLSNRL